MRSAPPQASSIFCRRRLNSRQIVLLIVVAVHLALITALVSVVRSPPPDTPVSSAMELLPTFEPPAPQTAERAAEQAAPRPPTLQPVPVPRRPPPVRPPVLDIPDIDFDLAEVPRQPVAEPPAVETAEAGPAEKASGPVYGPVLGSRSGYNGQQLYNAEWFIEPTDAQLATYLPARRIETGSWAIVACKTIDGNRVEDCTELEESPRGSGLATAIRKAGWQFRIRPPREGSRSLVGSWVRVRISFTENGVITPD